MDSNSFLGGGSVGLVPAGTRARIFTRQVNRPGYDVELSMIGLGSQQSSAFCLVELVIGGQTVLSETFEANFSSSGYTLPFLRFAAMGLLEGYMTNGAGVDSTLTCHVEGLYVPRV